MQIQKKKKYKKVKCQSDDDILNVSFSVSDRLKILKFVEFNAGNIIYTHTYTYTYIYIYISNVVSEILIVHYFVIILLQNLNLEFRFFPILFLTI